MFRFKPARNFLGWTFVSSTVQSALYGCSMYSLEKANEKTNTEKKEKTVNKENTTTTSNNTEKDNKTTSVSQSFLLRDAFGQLGAIALGATIGTFQSKSNKVVQLGTLVAMCISTSRVVDSLVHHLPDVKYGIATQSVTNTIQNALYVATGSLTVRSMLHMYETTNKVIRMDVMNAYMASSMSLGTFVGNLMCVNYILPYIIKDHSGGDSTGSDKTGIHSFFYLVSLGGLYTFSQWRLFRGVWMLK